MKTSSRNITFTGTSSRNITFISPVVPSTLGKFFTTFLIVASETHWKLNFLFNWSFCLVLIIPEWMEKNLTMFCFLPRNMEHWLKRPVEYFKRICNWLKVSVILPSSNPTIFVQDSFWISKGMLVGKVRLTALLKRLWI